MIPWLFFTSFLLIAIGLSRLLLGYQDKSIKEEKSQDLLKKSEKLSRIAEDLNRSWKS